MFTQQPVDHTLLCSVTHTETPSFLTDIEAAKLSSAEIPDVLGSFLLSELRFRGGNVAGS